MLVLCGFALSQAFAQEKEAGKQDADKGFITRDYDLGISLGMWFSGNVNIDTDTTGIDVDKQGSLLVRAFADAYVAPKFAVGVYGNYSKFTLKSSDYDASVSGTLFEFGVSLKPRFLLSPEVAIKPGLNIGYRSTSRASMPGETNVDLSADGMGLNLSVELQIKLEGDYIFHIDGGFLSQPVGGTDDADVTWAPIMYLAAGITF
jgi:hypothetical protein